MRKLLRKISSLLLCITVLLSIASEIDFCALALDTNGQCGENVYYTFDELTGTVTIDGIGEMYNTYNYYTNKPPFYNNSDVKNVIINDGVTTVADYFFTGCKYLKTVSFSNTLITLGNSCFNECASLIDILLPDSLENLSDYVFKNCINLSSVTLNSNLKSIGYQAFCGCVSLKRIDIPDNVISLGSEVFYNCTGLKSATVGNNVPEIKGRVFYQCLNLEKVILGRNISSVGTYAFYNCSNLADINIPNGVTNIESYSFSKCASLKKLNIPDSVTIIKENSFRNCSNITDINIGNSVTTIDNMAFLGCSNLKSITFGNSITNIGINVFYGCDNLNKINYVGSSEQWDKISFGTGNDCLEKADIIYNYTGHTHTYGEWVYNNDAQYVSSSDYKNGTATRTCTECGESETKEIEGTGLLRANSASVTLGAAVVLNMAIDVSRQEPFENVCFEVEYAGQTYKVDDIDSERTTDTRTYFDFDKISPEKFGDEVVITPVGVTSDGIVCKGHSVNYSVKKYCYTTLNKWGISQNLKKLLVELLYYGEAYQQYRGYKHDNLVTSELTSEQKALHTVEVPDYTKLTDPKCELNPNGEENNEVTFKSVSMLLEGKVIPKVKFEIPTTASIEDYTFTWSVNGKETSFTYAEHPEWFTKTSNTVYYVDCQILKANQFSIPFYLTVSKNGKQVSNKLRYSVESYATSTAVANNSKLKTLVDQILRYGRADINYMNGTN